MAFQHQATGTGSDQELLDIARASLARVMASGRRYRIGSREVELPSVDELRRTIKELEDKIAAANTATGGSHNYARFVLNP